MSCDVMSCDVKSCEVKSCDVMSCDVMSCDVMSCDVLSCDVVVVVVASFHLQGGRSGGRGTGGGGRSLKEGIVTKNLAADTGLYLRSMGLRVVGYAGHRKR
jgi:hypothetical protein